MPKEKAEPRGVSLAAAGGKCGGPGPPRPIMGGKWGGRGRLPLRRRWGLGTAVAAAGSRRLGAVVEPLPARGGPSLGSHAPAGSAGRAAGERPNPPGLSTLRPHRGASGPRGFPWESRCRDLPAFRLSLSFLSLRGKVLACEQVTQTFFSQLRGAGEGGGVRVPVPGHCCSVVTATWPRSAADGAPRFPAGAPREPGFAPPCSLELGPGPF